MRPGSGWIQDYLLILLNLGTIAGTTCKRESDKRGPEYGSCTPYYYFFYKCLNKRDWLGVPISKKIMKDSSSA